MLSFLQSFIVSVKDKDNQSSRVEAVNIKNSRAFLYPANVNMVTKEQYRRHKQNGGMLKYNTFEEKIPILMKKWSTGDKLNEYRDVAGDNWSRVLAFTNKRFLDEHESYFSDIWHIKNSWGDRSPDINMFRHKFNIRRGPDGKRACLLPIDMTASDFESLDVWKETETTRWNAHFRNNNQIPYRETLFSHRPYDRSNEGLRATNWRNASKINPVRGYNMETIYHAADKIDSDEWMEFDHST